MDLYSAQSGSIAVNTTELQQGVIVAVEGLTAKLSFTYGSPANSNHAAYTVG